MEGGSGEGLAGEPSNRLYCWALAIDKKINEGDDDFQVRSRQWRRLVDSEGISSTYDVLDLY